MESRSSTHPHELSANNFGQAPKQYKAREGRGQKCVQTFGLETRTKENLDVLTHCGRVTQICVFNTVKLGTSASSL